MPKYCESSQISLQNPGMLYAAVQMLGDIQVPRHDDMNLLLGFVASFLDIDAVKPASPTEKIAWLNLVHSRDTYEACFVRQL